MQGFPEFFATLPPIFITRFEMGSHPGAKGIHQAQLPWPQLAEGRAQVTGYLAAVPGGRTAPAVPLQPLLPVGIVGPLGARGQVHHSEAAAFG
jgi:hypothetical protein